MKIGHDAELVRMAAIEPSIRRPTAPKTEAEQRDTVEISDNGRQRLAELADAARRKEESSGRTGEASKSSEQSDSIEVSAEAQSRQEQVAQIKARLADGYYDRADIRTMIADRLIFDMDL